jgi:hypothetical protein
MSDAMIIPCHKNNTDPKGQETAKPEGSAASLLHSLPGLWRLQRYDEKKLVMEGQMQLVPKGHNRLHYREHGHHYLPDGQNVTFVRDYLYQLDKDRLTIFFEQNPSRLFLDMVLQQGPEPEQWTCSGEHPCGEDIYRSSYHFHSSAYFQIIHSVSGPRKDYCLDTQYHKIQ